MVEHRSTPAESGILIGLALIITSACVALGTLAIHTPNATQKRAEYQSNTSKAYCEAKLGAIGVDPRAISDKAVTEKPDQKDYYDLCQQVRMAEAAEDSASIAWLQLVASSLGVLGLVWTVYLTRKATQAATQAARQATRANEVQIRVEAPIVHLKEIKTSRSDTEGLPGVINARFLNSGKTPAIIIEGSIEHSVSPDAELGPTPIYGDTHPIFDEVLDPGEKYALATFMPASKLKPAFNLSATVVIWGYIIYRDVVGHARRRGFGQVSIGTVPMLDLGQEGGVTLIWKDAGGAAYNYDRPEPERDHS